MGPEDPVETIGQLEQQADLDRKWIGVLEAQGEIDRHKIAGLEVALTTCRRIGAALGILMASRRLTEDAAFEELRSASQLQHRKLREIADYVIETGTLD